VRCLVWFFTLSLAAGISAAPLDKDEVPYAHPGGKTLLLRLHVPDGAGPFPAAILVHGGGFDEGDRNRFIVPTFDVMSNAGFAWFSIDYRLGPEFHFPDAAADVNSAIEWVRQNAASYKVDVSRIALIGESAGGFLVNSVGTHQTAATKVAAVVDFYGPSDYLKLTEERRDHPERFNMATARRHAAHGGGMTFFGAETLDATGVAKLREVSPIHAVHSGMPPFLCIHGNKDDQVTYQQSVDFCAAIQKAGSHCELVTVDGGGHGMSSWRAPEMQHWKSDMIGWLKKTLKLSEQ
jgi:acetyl esterase